MIIKIFLISILTVSIHAKENFETIFYQPLNKDVNTIVWGKKLVKLKNKGINKIILQWTKHNNTNFYEVHNKWFKNLFYEANKQNIKIIVGLYANSNFFKSIKKKEVSNYLKELEYKNKQLITELLPFLKKQKSFQGWYLYEEIDDLSWRKKEKQKALKIYLSELENYLFIKTQKKTYISGFFSGNMSPYSYLNMWNNIVPKNTIVLLQNGVGANNNTIKESEIYFRIFEKHFKNEWQPIIELFEYKNSNFINAKKRNIQQQINSLPENKKPIAFSLRYLE